MASPTNPNKKVNNAVGLSYLYDPLATTARQQQECEGTTTSAGSSSMVHNKTATAGVPSSRNNYDNKILDLQAQRTSVITGQHQAKATVASSSAGSSVQAVVNNYKTAVARVPNPLALAATIDQRTSDITADNSIPTATAKSALPPSLIKMTEADIEVLSQGCAQEDEEEVGEVALDKAKEDDLYILSEKFQKAFCQRLDPLNPQNRSEFQSFLDTQIIPALKSKEDGCIVNEHGRFNKAAFVHFLLHSVYLTICEPSETRRRQCLVFGLLFEFSRYYNDSKVDLFDDNKAITASLQSQERQRIVGRTTTIDHKFFQEKHSPPSPSSSSSKQQQQQQQTREVEEDDGHHQRPPTTEHGAPQSVIPKIYMQQHSPPQHVIPQMYMQQPQKVSPTQTTVAVQVSKNVTQHHQRPPTEYCAPQAVIPQQRDTQHRPEKMAMAVNPSRNVTQQHPRPLPVHLARPIVIPGQGDLQQPRKVSPVAATAVQVSKNATQHRHRPTTEHCARQWQSTIPQQMATQQLQKVGPLMMANALSKNGHHRRPPTENSVPQTISPQQRGMQQPQKVTPAKAITELGPREKNLENDAQLRKATTSGPHAPQILSPQMATHPIVSPTMTVVQGSKKNAMTGLASNQEKTENGIPRSKTTTPAGRSAKPSSNDSECVVQGSRSRSGSRQGGETIIRRAPQEPPMVGGPGTPLANMVNNKKRNILEATQQGPHAVRVPGSPLVNMRGNESERSRETSKLSSDSKSIRVQEMITRNSVRFTSEVQNLKNCLKADINSLRGPQEVHVETIIDRLVQLNLFSLSGAFTEMFYQRFLPKREESSFVFDATEQALELLLDDKFGPVINSNGDLNHAAFVHFLDEVYCQFADKTNERLVLAFSLLRIYRTYNRSCISYDQSHLPNLFPLKGACIPPITVKLDPPQPASYNIQTTVTDPPKSRAVADKPDPTSAAAQSDYPVFGCTKRSTTDVTRGDASATRSLKPKLEEEINNSLSTAQSPGTPSKAFEGTIDSASCTKPKSAAQKNEHGPDDNDVHLLHPAFSLFDSERKRKNSASFSYSNISISSSDLESLERDPSTAKLDSDLYGTDQIIRCFHQWTLRGVKWPSFCHLPGAAYSLIQENSDVTTNQPLLAFTNAARGRQSVSESIDVFKHRVIDFTIHTGSTGFHFSKAWVVNSMEVLRQKGGGDRDKMKDDDLVPVILIADSLPGLEGHQPDTIADNIRDYLNSLDKYNNFSDGDSFTAESLPSFTLTGKWCVALLSLSQTAMQSFSIKFSSQCPAKMIDGRLPIRHAKCLTAL